MNDSGSINNGSYFHNTYQSLKKKVFSSKVEASLNSNMAAPPQERNLDIIKLDAREMALDTMHYAAQLEVQSRPSKHAKTMRRTVDEVKEKHLIVFNAMIRKLELPTVEQEGNHEFVKKIIYGVANGMFSDRQRNWGRVVSMYALAGLMAKHFADNGLPSHVDLVGHCVADYVCENLAQWIHTSGGWDAFDEYFYNGNKLEDRIWQGLLLVGGIGAVALGMVAVR